MDGGAQASSIPIYNKFVELAKKLLPHYTSLIMPSRWMTGGRGLDGFRADMITDTHIRMLYDYMNANACFTNVEIKGGICYFLWDKAYKGECLIQTFFFDQVITSSRYLKEPEDDIFIRDSRLINIKRKVQSVSKGYASFSSIVSSMKPYGLRGDFFKDTNKYKLPALKSSPLQNGIAILGLDDKQHRIYKYASRSYPLPRKDGLWEYKIFVPRNWGIGRIGEAPTNCVIAEPGVACTETFVQVGPFKTKEEAENCLTYMQSKLFLVMVGIRKQDQGAGKDVYAYAPVQDFSKSWTDAELYRMYSITEEEIKFIESLPMS